MQALRQASQSRATKSVTGAGWIDHFAWYFGDLVDKAPLEHTSPALTPCHKQKLAWTRPCGLERAEEPGHFLFVRKDDVSLLHRRSDAMWILVGAAAGNGCRYPTGASLVTGIDKGKLVLGVFEGRDVDKVVG
jgi:hypothetical protein